MRMLGLIPTPIRRANSKPNPNSTPHSKPPPELDLHKQERRRSQENLRTTATYIRLLFTCQKVTRGRLQQGAAHACSSSREIPQTHPRSLSVLQATILLQTGRPPASVLR